MLPARSDEACVCVLSQEPQLQPHTHGPINTATSNLLSSGVCTVPVHILHPPTASILLHSSFFLFNFCLRFFIFNPQHLLFLLSFLYHCVFFLFSNTGLSLRTFVFRFSLRFSLFPPVFFPPPGYIFRS